MKTSNIKRIVIIFTAITIFFITLTGFSFCNSTVDVSFIHNGKFSFYHQYKISYMTSLKLAFRYRNNYYEMYRNEYLGNPKGFLDILNSEIYNDAQRYFNTLISAPKDATAIYDGDGVFEYTKERSGIKINAEKTFINIIENNFSPSSIITETLYPSLTLEDVKLSTVKVSSFKTHYSTSSSERKYNLELATKKLDGATVLPGQILSFNEIVGKRTKENGYRTAKVIENGIYVDGIGGGVCQVSGTLMNAWLLANLDVAYSRNHSLPSSYIKPGLDATVSESIDLLLKNNSEFPIYIDASFDGSVLEFSLYGKHSGYDVTLISELIREIPCDEYEIVDGTEDVVISPPINGKIYKTKLLLQKDGKVVEERFFRTSTYLPIKGKKIITKTDNSKLNSTQ